MPQFTTYFVRQGDTLEAIAFQFLGDVGRWTDVAAINRLRSPYISDRPLDQYDTPLWQSILQYQVTPQVLPGSLISTGGGSLLGPLLASTYTSSGTVTSVPSTTVPVTSILQSDVDPLMTLPGAQFYVELPTPSGIVYDLVPILSYTPPASYTGIIPNPGPPGTFPGTLIFAGGIQHSYPPGCFCAIVPELVPSSYRVAITGQAIYLPTSPRATSVQAQGGPGTFTDLLGIDVLLAGDQLQVSNGDLATVGGTANIKQAIDVRLSVEPGELVSHPDYGNPLITLVGKKVDGSTASVAQGMASLVARADPRVRSSRAIDVRLLNPETILVNMALEIVGLSESIRIDVQSPLLAP